MGRRLLTVLAAAAWLAPNAVAAQVLGAGQSPGISVVHALPPPPPSPPPSPPGPARPSGPSHGPAPGVPMTGDQFLAGPRTYAPRYDRRSQRPGRLLHPFGYSPFVGGYWPYFPDVPDEPREVDAKGRLLLQLTPGSAQVFVDGFYVGAAEDFAGSGLWLESGSHRVELRADGFEPVAFDVRVVEGETVDYRKDLARITAQPAPPAAAAPAKTFYVIPGCYAGDSPPRGDRLPAGCSTRNLRIVPPVLNTVRAR